jgi:RHS repeat-associated protein
MAMTINGIVTDTCRRLLGRPIRKPTPRRRINPRLCLEEFEPRVQPSKVFWNIGASGDWNVGSNWSTGNVPGPSDDVVINRSVPVTVTIGSGDQSVNSLQVTNNDALTLTAGSLTAANGITINSGTLNFTGGTLGSPVTLVDSALNAAAASGPASFTFYDLHNLLSGTVGQGVTLTVQGNNPYGTGALAVADGTVNNGTIDLTSGYGGNAAQLDSQGTFTNAATGTIEAIQGGGGNRYLNGNIVNLGTITPDSGIGLTLQNGTFTQSSGTINSTGGLYVSQETFNADGGILNVNDYFQVSQSTLNLNGGTTSNGPVTILDATLNAAATATGPASFIFYDQHNTLSGTVSQSVTLTVQGNNPYGIGALAVADGTVNDGIIDLNSGYGGNSVQLNSQGTFTNGTSGTIEVIQGGGGNRYLNGNVTNQGTLIVDSGITLNSQNGLFTQGGGSINSNGGFASSLESLNFNGGTSVFNSSVTLAQSTLNLNGGNLNIAAGSVFDLSGNFTQSSSATLTLAIGGTPASGNFSQVNISGVAALAGTLQMSVVNGYDLHQGDHYQVMAYNSYSGQFASLAGLYEGRTLALEVDVLQSNVVVNALVNPADLAVSQITVPQSAVPGQNVTVSYSVDNLQPNATYASSWVDSVYLSFGTTFQVSDPLIARVQHTGVLNGKSSYTQTLSAALPAAVPGSYHVIVIADSEGFVADANRANNTLASTDDISVTMATLTPGTSVSGTIAGGQDVFYQVPLTAGAVVLISASFGSAGGGQLYERYQNVPTGGMYDQLGFDPSRAQQQITLHGAQAGNYYLWLHGVAVGSQAYTITVQSQTFGITSTSPTNGSDGGSVTVTVHGSQFSTKTDISLLSGGSTLSATKILLQDDSTLFATFDLTRLSPGIYTVQIQDPNQNNGQPFTDPGAFTVNTGSVGQVTFNLSCSAFTHDNNPGTITINYTNVGNTDAPAPLLILTGVTSVVNTGVEFLIHEPNTPPVSSSIQLLGINQNGPAGILPPGYQGMITLDFQPINQNAHEITYFTLSTIPSPDTPFDWSSVESDLQPSDVPSDAWAAIYQNFTAQVGTTLGQYQQVLDNDATYLSTLGEYTYDVSRLLSFELQKADDFGAISQRYTLGAFGRGWPDPTAIRAVADSSGNVTIEYSGRVRSFFIQPDENYRGVPGDAATLTKEQDGSYQLRETDGTITAFNTDGTLAYTQDTNGNKITANYTSGQLTSFVDSTGDTVAFTYNGQGRISQVTDPVGRVTTYAYDPTGQLLTNVTDPTGTTSYTYVPGQGAPDSYALASITYPDGSQTLFSYDAQGRLTSQEADQAGDQKVTYAYDGEGGISVTDAGGGTSTYFVNEFEQVGAYEDPLGHFTHFVYDANHNLVQETGPDGITSTFTYNTCCTPTGLTDPLGHHIQATYDPTLNRLTSLTDPNGNTTQYGHDANGNLLSITYPDSSQEQFTYDPMGNLIDSVDRNGTAIDYKYDAHNLLLEEDFADGSKATYTYDAHRNLISATNANGTTSFQYDAADRLVKVTYPNGMFLEFTYNAAGQRIQMVDQTGFTVNYQYDTVGRLAGLTDGSGNLIVKYTYDAAGRLSRKDMGNGTYTIYGYDLAGSLTSIVNYKPDNSALSQYVYAYDDQGRPTSVTTLTGTTTYGYDATDQLMSVSLPGGRTITYQYDAAGNRVAVTDSGVATNYTTNNLNEYTQVGSTIYTYDKHGNLISQTDNTGTTSYGYDALGQLVSIASPQGTWTYQYDALGNRIAETQNGLVTQYLIDPTGIGNVVGTFDGSGSAVNHYTQGIGLASQVNTTGVAAYYNFDLTGNTTELTGADGVVLGAYSYLPFGGILTASGASANPFRYGGQFGVVSDGSGQVFMRNRCYDPVTGRFTRPDPIGISGGSNLYAYAHNNPVRYADPSGKCPVCIIVLVAVPVLIEDGPALEEWAVAEAPQAEAWIGTASPEFEAWAQAEFSPGWQGYALNGSMALEAV